MKREYVIGVDPGLSGAIAVFRKEGMEFVGVRDMPVMPALHGKGKTVDCIELKNLLEPFAQHDVTCYIEAVSAMPKQGLASTFKFGKVAMAPEAIAHCYGFRISFITPVAWKRAAKLIKKDKEVSLSRAKTLFPSFAENFRLKKHEGRAEATLIAYFGHALDHPEPEPQPEQEVINAPQDESVEVEEVPS